MTPLLLALVLAGRSVIPLDAEIVDGRKNPSDAEPVGNVLVTFADGHHEKWTHRGECMMPHVSNSGLVGWVRIVERNPDGSPSFPVVRVCWPDGHHQDVGLMDSYPYFDAWCFAANDTAVVIESGYERGPRHFVEYELHSGGILAIADGPAIPAWASGLVGPARG